MTGNLFYIKNKYTNKMFVGEKLINIGNTQSLKVYDWTKNLNDAKSFNSYSNALEAMWLISNNNMVLEIINKEEAISICN